MTGETPSTDTTPSTAEGHERFTVDTAREMFSFRGKSPTGEGVDVSIVRKHYHPDVRFRDAIQKVQGRDAVIEMLLRFPQRCKELRCIVHRAVQEGNVIFVEWTTEMVITAGSPPSPTTACSRLVARRRRPGHRPPRLLRSLGRHDRLVPAGVEGVPQHRPPHGVSLRRTRSGPRAHRGELDHPCRHQPERADQMPHAFVTGASGFVGSEVAIQLCNAGWKVTASRRSTSGTRVSMTTRSSGWRPTCSTPTG